MSYLLYERSLSLLIILYEMNNVRNIFSEPTISTARIPTRIFAYMKKYFDQKDLSGIKRLKNKGQVYYKLDITTENNVYRLKFNSKGLLMEKVMEPLFDNILDETGVGD